MFKMFKRQILKIYVGMKGIRFYTTDRTPVSPEFMKSEFLVVGGKKVEFFFYKEVYTDYVRKYFSTMEVQHVAYSIRMQVDDDVPNHLRQFNNLKVVFKYDSIAEFLEDDLHRILLVRYLHFLEDLIQKQTLKPTIP
jgi:hypothetical protein